MQLPVAQSCQTAHRGPLVSVIMPAYEVAAWIGEALASVMAQTVQDWEVIVVNDGSPDTSKLEDALRPFRDRIRYHVQPHRGAGAARNAALALSSGEWVAFLDGDDAWLPTYLERQLQLLRERDLDLIWSDGFECGSGGEGKRLLMARSPSRGPVTVTALINGDCHVFTSGAMVRRALVDAVGGFDESLKRAQDFELWVRLLLAGARAGYHSEPLFRYRLHDRNLSGDVMTRADRALTVFQYIEAHLDLSTAERAALLRRIGQLEAHRAVLLGKRALAAGEYAEAVRCFRDAYARGPSPKLAAMLALLAVGPSLARRIYLARVASGRP